MYWTPKNYRPDCGKVPVQWPVLDVPFDSRKYLAAIEFLYSHNMTRKEAAYFRRQRAAKLKPLLAQQTKILSKGNFIHKENFYVSSNR